MRTPRVFPQADFLSCLENAGTVTNMSSGMSLSPTMARIMSGANDVGERAQAVRHLIDLLSARKAMLKAAFDTEVVADELRRYQKYARPGQPSPHIVQLRQQQASARQASSQSRQAFIKAAAAFVRDADIEVPQRASLEVFIIGWIEAHVPRMHASAEP
jgi:hypothetical protein